MRSPYRSLLAGALATLCIAGALEAQTATGRIVGRVIDAGTGQPISGAQLVVVGTRIGVLSNVDGRYILMGVPAGQQSINVTYIGFAPKTIEGIAVGADRAVAQDISLASAAVAIGEIVVTSARETGSVNVALDQQRTAIGVMSATTLEQISKSPD